MRWINIAGVFLLFTTVGQASSISRQAESLDVSHPIDEVGGFEIGNGRVVKFDSQEDGFSFYHHERLETVKLDRKIYLLPKNSRLEEKGILISQLTMDSSQVSKLVGKWLLSGLWKFDTYSGRHALRADVTDARGEIIKSEVRVFKNEDEMMIIHFDADQSDIDAHDLELVLKTLTVKD